jgi:hypothetical protein
VLRDCFLEEDKNKCSIVKAEKKGRFLNWKVASTGDSLAEEKYKNIKITFFVCEQYTE